LTTSLWTDFGPTRHGRDEAGADRLPEQYRGNEHPEAPPLGLRDEKVSLSSPILRRKELPGARPSDFGDPASACRVHEVVRLASALRRSALDSAASLTKRDIIIRAPIRVLAKNLASRLGLARGAHSSTTRVCLASSLSAQLSFDGSRRRRLSGEESRIVGGMLGQSMPTETARTTNALPANGTKEDVLHLAPALRAMAEV